MLRYTYMPILFIMWPADSLPPDLALLPKRLLTTGLGCSFKVVNVVHRFSSMGMFVLIDVINYDISLAPRCKLDIRSSVMLRSVDWSYQLSGPQLW
jgi:hypothetical protein